MSADAKAKAAISKALRQRNNENAAKFFAAGMAGMIFLFIVFRWSRVTFVRYCLRTQHSGFLDIPQRIARRARSIFLHKVPGFTSGGHALLFVGYLATCIAVSFFNLDWSSLVNWAKRLGWVALSNIAFITFLSLKNTPLGFLTGYSYERLNALHQVAGYCTITWSMLHAVVYIAAWSQTNSLPQLLETDQIMGIIAGFAMLTILGTALLLRKLRYEVFYIVHVVMFMLILIVIGMHRPKISQKTLIITIFAACIWISDRTLRFLKVSFFAFGNAATITPLQCGGTRIVLRRSPRSASPGSHCFVWIPGIRMAETHPFTVVSKNPLEFVIAACDGFTRDLHAFALKHPGQSLRASIHGPYGSAPDFTGASKVLFIAGGSGASFSLGAAVDLVRKLGNSRATRIDIIWAVRVPEILEWYATELEVLESSPLVTIRIHATRGPSSSPNTPISRSSMYTLAGLEKASPLTTSPPETPVSPRDSANYDIEKHPESEMQSPPSTIIEAGRPDVARFIVEMVQNSDANDRIAVAACGPEGLMQTARKAVAECIKIDGPSLELHCEQFGF